MSAWKEIGCLICGHTSKTEKEAAEHFDKRHKGDPTANECPIWVAYFKDLGDRIRQEAANECVC